MKLKKILSSEVPIDKIYDCVVFPADQEKLRLRENKI